MTFKPQLEDLEDRVALDSYIGSHMLYQDVVIPKVTSTITGRVTAIAVDPSDPSGNSYIGSANGGIWKTTDGGATWAGGSQIGSPGVLKSIDCGHTWQLDAIDLTSVAPFAPGGADSIWIDIDAPVMTAPDGRMYR
jgi:hypothetical protein